MKFLCEHCKAKYQIADEKAAGRTVRMKCRKCGNMIEVRAAVTETGAVSKPPSEPAPQAPGPSEVDKPGRTGGGLATSLSNAPKPAPARPVAPRASDAGGGLSGAFQRSVQKKDDDISVALDLRELSASDEWYVAINGVPVGPIRVAELRRKAALGVVGDESLCWHEGMEEWRPVRAVPELAALVREAAEGGRPSLASPAVPEPPKYAVATKPSAGVVRPATSGPFAPQPAAAIAPSPAAAAPHATASSPGSNPAPAPAPAAARPPRPAVGSSPGARSNVVPFTSRLATAEKLQEEPAPVSASVDAQRAPAPPHPMIAPDPFAAPSPFAAPALEIPVVFKAPPSSLTSGPAVSALGTTSAPPAVVPVAQPASIPAAASSSVPAIVEKKAPPFIAMAMIALAAAFGVTAAIVLLKPATQVVVQVPAAPVPPPQTAAAVPPPPPPAAAPSESVAAAEPAAPAGAGKASAAGGGARPSSGSGATKPTAPTDPALRELIAGAAAGSGPAAGPGEGASGGGGAALTESQVQSVLQSHQVGLKRTCWDRVQTSALTVNESVHIVVGAGGQVTQASATGNEPAVGHCIETEVRRWTFPGTGEINIPFHFLRQ